MPNLTNNIQGFSVELDFEKALATLLTEHGWEEEIIMNPTEQQLVDNWAAIIFDNNRDINRLGNWPLTSSEINQIIMLRPTESAIIFVQQLGRGLRKRIGKEYTVMAKFENYLVCEC